MNENIFVLKLNDNENIISGIQKFAEENKIDFGYFSTITGRVRDCEIVSTEPRAGISKNKIPGDNEIKAVSGKLEKGRGGKINISLRVSLASSLATTKSGELVNGKTAGFMEIGIKKVDAKKIIGA